MDFLLDNKDTEEVFIGLLVSLRVVIFVDIGTVSCQFNYLWNTVLEKV